MNKKRSGFKYGKNNKTYSLINGNWKRKDHYSNGRTCLECGISVGNTTLRCKKCSGIVLKGGSWGKHIESTKKQISLIGKEKHNSPKTEFKKGRIPWNKGLTKETDIRLKNISEALKGKKLSKEHIKNLKKAYKNQTTDGKTYEEIYGLEKANWMKMIRTGKNNPFYGKKHTKRAIEINRKAHLGKKASKETVEKMSLSMKKLVEQGQLKTLFKKGEQHPYWQDGKSFEPYSYDFNKAFKETIRKRDNYCCMLCNLFEEDAKKLYKKRLAIHHVDYDKKNSFPQNCISLCYKCHGLTHQNRDHWKTFFQNLLKERYDYNYTEDQKIILDFTRGE